MKLKKLFVLSICAISLAMVGCSNNDNNNNNNTTLTTSSNNDPKPISGENISILNSKSFMFKDVIDLDNSMNFTTYKAKLYGEVPYIDTNDLKSRSSPK